MGIENRDYVRGGSSPGYGGFRPSYSSYGAGGMPPACKWILIVTIAVFVLQLVWVAKPSDYQVERIRKQVLARLELENERVPLSEKLPQEILEREAKQYALQYKESRNSANSVVQRWLELDPDRVFPGFQLWRPITYAFCHATQGGPWHIVFNMLAFWFFAPTLERMYGTREFTWFYLTASAASGLVFLLLEFWLGDVIRPAIGASGAVMAVLMLYAIHYPRQIIRIWGIIPIEVRFIVGLFVIYDLYPVLKSIGGAVPGDNVAHSAHLGGLLFGYVYYKFQLRISQLFSGFSLPEISGRSASRGNLRLYEPPDPEVLEEQVDAILQKISESGEASLTDQERETLKAASQRYKKRT